MGLERFGENKILKCNNMSEILRFKLNKKYRNPVSAEAQESIFYGRNDEINRLKNLIQNRDSATVLVSGVRGVGKTSFAREVLRRINNSDADNKYVVVDISFANFDPSDKYIKSTVLKAIIRGLYFSKNMPEVKELNALYDKTYYSDIKESGLLEVVKQSSVESSVTNTKENKYTLSLNENIFRVLASAGVSIVDFWILLPLLSGWQFIVALVTNIFLVGLLMIKIERITIIKNSDKNLDQISKKVGGTNIAQLDLSPDTLEIKLQQLLKDCFSNSSKKAVFVIDELDKIEKTGDNNGIDQYPIYKIIRPLKNLFTLSNAIFIFITDDEFYDDFEKEKNDSPYSTSYTLFTDKIFLPALYYQDVENLIDKFKDGELKKGNGFDYKKFKSFISWQAKNHIFDVHNLVENYTNNKNDGSSYVSVQTNEEIKKGNIEDDWETAAALQVYLSAVYDNHFYPDNHRLNEKLYLTLRQVCEILYQDYEISIKDNNYLTILSDDIQKKLKVKELSENERKDFAGAIEDLLRRMETRGLLESSEEIKEVYEGKSEKIINFEVINTEYPDIKDIKEVNKQLSYEQDFIANMDKLNVIKNNLQKEDVDALDDYSKEIEKFNKYAKPIKEEEYRRLRKSQVDGFTERIKDIINSSFNRVVNLLIDKLIEKDGSAKRYQIDSGVANQPLWEEDVLLSNFYNNINTELTRDNYNILCKSNKYILFGFNFNKEIQDEYLSIRSFDRHRAKTRVINLVLSESNTIKKARKWCTFYIEDDFGNLKEVRNELLKIFRRIK